MPKYSTIIPVFNEEEVINETYLRLNKVMSSVSENYELIFVDDGSSDNSAPLIKHFCQSDSRTKLISLSRNFGHQIAISAGIEFASGEAVIIIDADLQDPPEVIPEMISKWNEGYEIVYGKRKNREGESLFKRITAKIFYRMLNGLTGYKMPVDTGDFRLIDKKVCNVIKELKEKSRYMRGLISWAGFKSTFVEYNRGKRLAGSTKYSIGKMIDFALTAIFSFSNFPLRIASCVGFILSFFSFLYLLVAVYEKLFTNYTIIGWTSIIALNSFFNGIVLIILGIIGEYIGRIYDETKGRPLFILKEVIGFNK